MAKRKAGRAAKKAAPRKKAGARSAAARSTSAKRAASTRKTVRKSSKAGSGRKTAKGQPKKAAAKVKRAPARKTAAKTTARGTAKAKARTAGGRKRPAPRPEFEDTIPSPPSSLNMNRKGSAVRTGRAEIAEERADHANMTPAITGGDVDADVEDAYFTGDEAPGGDNTTPDQDVVDEIGRALGVEYQDNEELRGSDKVAARDKHRWELDPASAEDYRDRK